MLRLQLEYSELDFPCITNSDLQSPFHMVPGLKVIPLLDLLTHCFVVHSMDPIFTYAPSIMNLNISLTLLKIMALTTLLSATTFQLRVCKIFGISLPFLPQACLLSKFLHQAQKLLLPFCQASQINPKIFVVATVG